MLLCPCAIVLSGKLDLSLTPGQATAGVGTVLIWDLI